MSLFVAAYAVAPSISLVLNSQCNHAGLYKLHIKVEVGNIFLAQMYNYVENRLYTFSVLQRWH